MAREEGPGRRSRGGTPRDYDSPRCLVRLAGLNPRPWSSGGFVGRPMLSYAGRVELRTVAHQAALSLLVNNPAFRARYRYLLTRPTHPLTPQQALCALAARLLPSPCATRSEVSRLLGDGSLVPHGTMAGWHMQAHNTCKLPTQGW